MLWIVIYDDLTQHLVRIMRLNTIQARTHASTINADL